MVKAALTGFKTATTQADPARGEADRAPRLQAGGRRARGHRRGDGRRRPSCRPSRRPWARSSPATPSQSLPLNGRNVGPARAAAARVRSPTTRAGFTNIGSINMNRPFVNGNREQTNNFTVDGLDVNETIDNRVAYQPSPDALAEISVETNNYAADVGNVGGRRHQQRHQVRRQPVPRQRVRVLPEQRLRREHLGEQPLGRAAPGAQAAHLRGHAGRAPS